MWNTKSLHNGLLLFVACAVCGAGCDQAFQQAAVPETMLTASNVRAERRAFDGAPPVVAHPPLTGKCITCHTAKGTEVPTRGFAPANPHLKTPAEGFTTNCRQCHVFALTEKTFVQNAFVGLPQDLRRGERLFEGAPPIIPHAVYMRENCAACHGGLAARPEIVCDHLDRTNCSQCHLQRVTSPDDIAFAVESKENLPDASEIK